MVKKLNKLLKMIVEICKIIILLINLIVTPYLLALTYVYNDDVKEVLYFAIVSFVLYILIYILYLIAWKWNNKEVISYASIRYLLCYG